MLMMHSKYENTNIFLYKFGETLKGLTNNYPRIASSLDKNSVLKYTYAVTPPSQKERKSHFLRSQTI